MMITIDFETRSEADLRLVGPWAYSEHPSTEVICMAWAIDDEPVQGQMWPGLAKPPDSLLDKIWNPYCLFEAFNAAFEYAIWENICVRRFGWPRIPLHLWRDLQAVACYYSLPPALGNLCRVLGLSGKDPDGDRLISRYSKLHLKTAKDEIPLEDQDKFLEYCKQDADQERQAGELLGKLPEYEEENFLHDFEVGARGIALDEEGILLARRVVTKRSDELKSEFIKLTDLSPDQRDEIMIWLARNGCIIENLQADTIDERLAEDDDIPKPARRALEIRRRYAKASTKKLNAMLRQRGSDGRARFQTRYHGAVTGRNTGTGFQPLNLSRGWDQFEPSQLVRDVSYGDPRWLDALYGDAMEAVSKASRHWIVPREGHRIMAGDFASIEAVVLACLAGEEWKIEKFREPKPRIYETVAEKIFDLPEGSVSKESYPEKRQAGKILELACGFQGALGAYRQVDIETPDETVLRYVRGWRQLHPNTVNLWYELDNCAIEAVSTGQEIGIKTKDMYNIGFELVDSWLTMILPDGKRLWYWQPDVSWKMPKWHRPVAEEACRDGTCGHTKRPTVTYWTQKEGRWQKTHGYGGKWCENLVQAICRQMLKPAEKRVERAGYPVILSVYDEIVTEPSLGHGSAEELKELMEMPAGDWCANWPVRAEVFQGMRYRK